MPMCTVAVAAAVECGKGKGPANTVEAVAMRPASTAKELLRNPAILTASRSACKIRDSCQMMLKGCRS